MTPAEKIAELRTKVAAATAAPWRVDEVDYDLWKAIRHGHGLSGRMVADCLLGGDAPAVAAMRNHFDALLDVAEAAQTYREFARNERDNGVGELESHGALFQALDAFDHGENDG